MTTLTEKIIDTLLAGDAASIASMLSSNPELTHARDSQQNTLLHILAKESPLNAVEIAQNLISSGADVNTPNGLGQHPLQLAINDIELVKVLLDSNAETAIYAENQSHMSPLEECLYNQRTDIAQLLVKYGAPVDLRVDAGLGNYDALCERIGQHGGFRYASIGLPNQPGPQLSVNDGLRQALAYAVRNGQIETIELLLDEGAPINDIVPHMGRIGTALHHAVEANQLTAAKVLTEHEASVDIVDETEHLTPLDLAKRLNAADIAKYLDKVCH